MTAARSAPLLLPGAAPVLREAYRRYPAHRDDVLDDVHARLRDTGAATKLDLAALIAWKHVRNAPWMTRMLATEPSDVDAVTRRAFAANLSDHQRVAALRPLPGFGSGGAFTSVLLTAWDPTNFGVYDRIVRDKRHKVVSGTCACDWTALPTYWEHLRAIATEMTRHGSDAQGVWTPRKVDMAMFNVD